MKKIKTKNILVTVGILILLVAVVYVRSRISPLFGNYSVEKNEKKVEAKPTMDTKSQETKKSQGKTETVRRHIVGGTYRTLISVQNPLRLCRTGICRSLSAG